MGDQVVIKLRCARRTLTTQRRYVSTFSCQPQNAKEPLGNFDARKVLGIAHKKLPRTTTSLI